MILVGHELGDLLYSRLLSNFDTLKSPSHRCDIWSRLDFPWPIRNASSSSAHTQVLDNPVRTELSLPFSQRRRWASTGRIWSILCLNKLSHLKPPDSHILIQTPYQQSLPDRREMSTTIEELHPKWLYLCAVYALERELKLTSYL